MTDKVGIEAARRRLVRDGAGRVLRSFVHLIASIGSLIGLWYAFIAVYHLNPYFAKTPVDVLSYISRGQESAAHRSLLLDALGITLKDAAIGFAVGTAIAILVSIALVSWPLAAATMMPIIVAARAIPLIAMTPVIALVFGRGLAGVTVITAIVTFFPTVVNLVVAMNSVQRNLLELMGVYACGPLTVLTKVRMPHALPALFASFRITAPTALLGALLAEWLATGSGLGSLMVTASVQSDFALVWTSVVVITVVAFILYDLIAFVENRVLSHYWPRG